MRILKTKTPAGDTTRSARAKAHLERLAQGNGKRLVVDLNEEANQALANLMETGYAATQKAAVSRALIAAASHSKKKS